jgi:PAS domain S-box-containing protein
MTQPAQPQVSPEAAQLSVLRLQRIEAVAATGLLDSPVEAEFDRLTRLAAKLTGAPVTFLSLVTSDRDFYKSCFGFPEPLATERQLKGTTFCHYAMVSTGPLVITDTLEHPIYRTVLTVETLGVRAYLGIPLVTSGGEAIGSFCAIDFEPRAWSALDVDIMQELAASTLREIELRSALRALAGEQRRLGALLEHIPAGIVYTEAGSGRIIMSNRKANELLGGAIRGRRGGIDGTWTGVSHDGHLLAPEEFPLSRAMRGEVVQNVEMQLLRVDGRRIWLRVDAAPVVDEDGAIIGGIAALHDVDAQRELAMENARLYELATVSNRAKDEFFAAVTHELRTPMTSILGWARLLRLEALESPDAIEAVEAITSSARLQAQLVDDLLDVSRIATGKLSLNRQPLSLHAVVEESMTALAPVATSKSVPLRLDLGRDAILDADRGRLRQVVGNILSNSIKFTPAGGLISIYAGAADGIATIRVQDTGRGIEPEVLPHIFDRFQQAENAELGGLGLGLTIVRHLVEMHGGSVEATSDGAGKGTTMTVTLPVQREIPTGCVLAPENPGAQPLEPS